MTLLEKKRIISLDISTGKYAQFIDQIIELAQTKPSYVCVANVHMTIEAYDNPDFAKCVNGADLVTPDGMPLAKALNRVYKMKQDRVAGMDIMTDLFKRAELESIPVFFYGGSQDTLDKTKDYLNKNYPNIILAGLISPPFRLLSLEEKQKDIELIRNSNAKLVFVALGCPKQERWMHEHKDKLDTCLIGIGGALPVTIGTQKRAPKIMQKLSLEWFYRLCLEPRRLFKRYFYTNTKFIYLFVKYYVLKRKP